MSDDEVEEEDEWTEWAFLNEAQNISGPSL